ncbi:MAG: acetate--CoA ligase family protein [bacterium]|nr:acetate--CoA ligase family protein [bacterium]
MRVRAAVELLAGQAARMAPQSPATFHLNEPEVYALLAALGLRHGACAVAAAGADLAAWARDAALLADRDGRLVLKLVGRDILHKTEAGGVRLLRLTAGDAGVAEAAAELARAAETMLAGARAAGVTGIEGVMAAAFVPHQANRPGCEVLLTLRQDPAFGPCVVVGIGGTLTEWHGAGATLVLPAVGLDAARVETALLGHPRLALLVKPSRLYSEPPLAVAELAAAAVALADLGQAAGPGSPGEWTLEELEINPAVAGPLGLTALDGVARVSQRKWPGRQRPLARVKALMDPRSAVVLGVSAKGRNPGRIIVDNLARARSLAPGRLYVVHPAAESIGGAPCFRDVASLPDRCDLAVIALPAQEAVGAVRELVEHDRAQAIILNPGGFAEAGRGDLAAEIESVLAAGQDRAGGGPVLVGGNCLGIVSRDRYNTFFLPEYKLPFRSGPGRNLALVSQSGAYLVTFTSNFDGVIEPRCSISFGNQMDLTVSDFLAHYIDEPEVDVFACYVEGFRDGDGARFLEQARRARARGMRVVMFKAGRTALGAQAAASHTASLAGDYAVARACLEEAGVDVAGSLDEFEDLIRTFTLLAGRPAAGNRVGIISNAGFECSTVTDELAGLRLADLDDAARAVLDGALPPFAHRLNPVDATPMADSKAFADCCAAILTCPGVDTALLSAVPVTGAMDTLPADPAGTHPEDIAGPGSLPALMLKAIEASAKPVVVVVDSGDLYQPLRRCFEAAGVPVFRKVDRAARALAAFCRSREGVR